MFQISEDDVTKPGKGEFRPLRGLNALLEEIGSRMAESPRRRLAADLLQIIAGEQLVTYEGRDGSPAWRQLPDLAEKCLEAAAMIYPEIDQPADSAFHEEILRQNAVMEGVIERLDTDVEARRARWRARAVVEGPENLSEGSFDEQFARSLSFQDAQGAGKEAE